MQPLGFEKHDHATCISDAVERADAVCRDSGLQFTPVRRRVLEILLSDHRARGAYEILDILRNEGLGSQPPVAYRALEFLVAHGFAHRIEKLNAFIACGYSEHNHMPAFLICRNCGSVAETDAAPNRSAVGRIAKAAGFHIERAIVEVEGLCPECQEAEA
ncbi:MAG: transcriptional repressor [Boseongicola sp.]|nr:transcriptional repressor [Boseongicola sp.]NNJ69534.1 transcriptional repressor [Boseongicola sp.]